MGRGRRSAPMATYVKMPSVTITVPLSSCRRAQASTSMVTLVRTSPFGCPLEIEIEGARFAIRRETAMKITVDAGGGA